MTQKIYPPLIIDDDIIEYAREGTVIGLKKKNGYQKFINEKTRRVNKVLNDISIFKDISIKAKEKLYSLS